MNLKGMPDDTLASRVDEAGRYFRQLATFWTPAALAATLVVAVLEMVGVVPETLARNLIFGLLALPMFYITVKSREWYKLVDECNRRSLHQ